MDFEVAKKQERATGVWDHYFLILKPSALNSPPDARVFSFFSPLFLPLPQHGVIMTRFQAHNHARYWRESARPIVRHTCVVPLSVQPLWYSPDLINAETR